MHQDITRPSIQYDNGVGHPFRQGLPTRIASIAKEEQDSEKAATATDQGLKEDASLFLLSFLAFFTAFSTFIF